MSEKELRQHRCCFTGHRPEKLQRPASAIISGLQEEIQIAISDGFRTFLSGMARGVDIWAAESILALQKQGASVRLICASPYRGVECHWDQEWQKRYRRVMEQADLVWFICPCYNYNCFQRRNEWMVDRSARVIAVYNGQQGGTRNTIMYAQEHNVPVVFL